MNPEQSAAGDTGNGEMVPAATGDPSLSLNPKKLAGSANCLN